MVEVFKTDVTDHGLANQVLKRLQQTFPNYRCNFDLEDCDNILRIEGLDINHSEVLEFIDILGLKAEVLPEDNSAHLIPGGEPARTQNL